MKQFILFASITVLLFSCHEKASIKNASTADDSTLTTAGKTIPDSSIAGYPYFDSSVMSHNSVNGYIDTFNIGAVNFRVIHYDSALHIYPGCVLQKYTNGKWQELFTMFIDYYNNYGLEDINNDGYKDFMTHGRYGFFAYLYLPGKMNIDTTNGSELGDFWILLDTLRNIYCENYPPRTIERQSDLYTFKENKKVILYSLEFIKDKSRKYIIALNFYKGDFNNSGAALIKSTKMHKDVYNYDFDYVDYWRKNYKGLLGYK